MPKVEIGEEKSNPSAAKEAFIAYEFAKGELSKYIELEREFNLKYNREFESIINPSMAFDSSFPYKIQTSNTNRLELKTCRLIDDFDTNKITLTFVRDELVERIENISGSHQDKIYVYVLKSIYIYKNSLVKTAEKLSYSERHVRRLLKEAIQKYACKYCTKNRL
jgi:hypothetical protein